MWFQKDFVVLVLSALIFVPCAINTVGDLQRTSKRLDLPGGNITSIEAAIAEIREQLGDINSVGYVLVNDPYDSSRANAYYFITQYALAPIHVHRLRDHRSREPRYVVGIFSSAYSREQYLRSNDLKLLKKYRYGVVLLESSGSDE